MRGRRALGTIAAAGVVTAGAVGTALTPGIVDRPHPCVVWAARTIGRCATVRVYEDRDRAAGRRLGIRVVVLPARVAATGAPIVFLTGGPGGSAIDAAGYALDALAPLRARHALVLVDQRGTGASDALDCDLAGNGLQAHVDGMFPRSAAHRCRDALAERADLRQYTTARAADDLAGVLDALGIRRTVLFGASYGGRLALTFVRRHPERVASVVAVSAPPPDHAIPSAADWAGRRVFLARMAECRADPACRAAAPDPPDDVRQVDHVFATRAVRVTRWNWRTLRVEPVIVSPDAFGEFTWRMLYDGGRARRMFALLLVAARGGWDGWVDAAAASGRWREYGTSRGLALAVLCTEDVPRLRPPRPSATTPLPNIGPPLVGHMIAACEGWPRGRVAPEDTLPVRAATPVLFLSGALDPIVPPEWADSARTFLPRSVHLIRPDAGHAEVDGCARAAIARFVDSGATAAMRAACLATWRVAGPLDGGAAGGR